MPKSRTVRKPLTADERRERRYQKLVATIERTQRRLDKADKTVARCIRQLSKLERQRRRLDKQRAEAERQTADSLVTALAAPKPSARPDPAPAEPPTSTWKPGDPAPAEPPTSTWKPGELEAAVADKLAIPGFLKRSKEDQAAIDKAKSDLADRQRAKAKGQKATREARRSGATRRMPLSGRAALDAIRGEAK